MKQRTSEWLGEINTSYHTSQFNDVYRSTVLFCEWLENEAFIHTGSEQTVLDIGCGMGANIFYMSKRFPHCKFVGVDINADLVGKGNKFFRENGIHNCTLEVGDIYNLDEKYFFEFDGVTSYQTLSWLPHYKKAIESMANVGSAWIALTSLFYDGPLSCKIEMQDYDENLQPISSSFYNVYSIPSVREIFRSVYYRSFIYAPFEIDIDIPRGSNKGRGTYTEKLKNGERMQMSGPLRLPWYFIGARRGIKYV